MLISPIVLTIITKVSKTDTRKLFYISYDNLFDVVAIFFHGNVTSTKLFAY